MKRLTFLQGSRLLIASLPLALAACADDPNAQLVTYAGWQQMEPFAEPRVVQMPEQKTVNFDGPSAALSKGDRLALASFLVQQGVKRGDSVSVAVVNPSMEGSPLASSRLGAVQQALNELGVIAAPSPARQSQGVMGLDQVMVTAYRAATLPLACPGYTSPVVFDEARRPISNPGCSTATNLGLMVVDPQDLVEGKPLPPADGEAATLAIQRYRAGQVIDVESESTTEQQ